MSNAPVDKGRRRFLTVATSVVGAAGAVGVAVPFIASWNPSEKAKNAGAPVEVNIGKAEPGQLIRVEWRGQPVWVVRRTPEMLASLEAVNDRLRDPNSDEPQQPEYAKNLHRSRKEEFFVAVGICTHLGCSPQFLDVGFSDYIEEAKSGFFCPCHGSTFDIAGRVFQGVPAPYNLVVPPHYYINDTTILVGEDGEQA
ncbi:MULTISPECIES: ubiquinol-cytochrome c reductase iron-sulfur subunit [Pseudidiomarina]|uniref:Ubiquinol-cytochrome c reductase iron-sulfur subunit n=4 Tax=Pseudidiomarina TaxID=2800384 RepID=A0A368UTE7_9GAMM|nr:MULTISPECIES: ubiquinol-cytochrome c reductase iron-sulfur subunit [Pseudidiomarina]MDT7525921.1 ubiquinol-cytochrome c reductase iron-sulfur subunit [Pseudidiomarina sp. GXY010]PWW13025.1 ubiquinol-cytochrome c reductase iron-sulfur subunit [Pseudidiomarina maritima]RBP90441.1 ubiquinol-cytochrome c reductase iron-sulfur subunit [Pseudidiomarina tainanensis]RCW32117.1 ubiquinol-cytochrome c reductase iron-sulfur subunit [Pseudidiomarina tainanensis]